MRFINYSKAFASVLVAQYIEHFCYGGIDVTPSESPAKSAKPIRSLLIAKVASAAAATTIALKTTRSQITGRSARSGILQTHRADQSKGNTTRRVSIKENSLPSSARAAIQEGLYNGKEQYGGSARSAASVASLESSCCDSSGDEEEDDEPTMSYMEVMRQKRAEEEAVAAKLEEEEKADRERKITDWLLWSCVVCNSSNRLPRHPLSHEHVRGESRHRHHNGPEDRDGKHAADRAIVKGDVFFESLGKGDLTRTVAVVKTKRDMPVCQKCFTYADYTPPLSSAHLFPHYEHRYQAFFNYPRPTSRDIEIHDPPVTLSPRVGGLRSLLRSLSLPGGHFSSSRRRSKRSHSDRDRFVFNDWRLPLYLRSTFQDVSRPCKKSSEFHVRGDTLQIILCYLILSYIIPS